MSHIYKLTLNKNTESFKKGQVYIGQSNGNRKDYLGGGQLVRNLKKKYGREIFDKEIIVSGEFSRKLLDELEIHYIRLYGGTSKGLNIAKGGSGGSKPSSPIYKYSKDGEFICEYVSIQEASKSIGIDPARIYDAVFAGNRTAGCLWSWAKSRSIQPFKHKYHKEVYRYTHKGEYIDKYESATAAAKILKVDRAAVLAVLDKPNRACRGYQFRSNKETTCETYNYGEHNHKEIHRYSLTGEYLNSYNSVKTAAKELGILNTGIARAAREQKGRSGGYQWRYIKHAHLEASKTIRTK